MEIKTEELDQEVGVLRRKEASAHSVRMLAAGIHSSALFLSSTSPS